MAAGRAPGVVSPVEPQPECAAVVCMLQACRVAVGLTLSDLAGLSGLTRQTVRRVERGSQLPSFDVVVRLCLGLGGEMTRALQQFIAAVQSAAGGVKGHIRPVTAARSAA